LAGHFKVTDNFVTFNLADSCPKWLVDKIPTIAKTQFSEFLPSYVSKKENQCVF